MIILYRPVVKDSPYAKIQFAFSVSAMKEIQKLLASNIRKARNKLGYSQLELAEKAVLSPGHLNDLEQGRKWVSASTLKRLSQALGLEPYQLLIPGESHPSLEKYDLLTGVLRELKVRVGKEMEETVREFLGSTAKKS